jgi:hypothetical protein
VTAPNGGRGRFDDDRWVGAFPEKPAPAPPPPTKSRPAAHEGLRRIGNIASLVFLIAGIVTTVAHFVPASKPSTAPAPVGNGSATPFIDYVYGDPTPAALKPAAAAHGAARTVCTDEIRPLPTRGAWECKGSTLLDTSEIGRRMKDIGGPCTHRVADGDNGFWDCWTRIAIPPIALHMPYAVPVMFGHLLPSTSGLQPSSLPTICRAESRIRETGGPWTCVNSQEAPTGWRFVEPVDPGGPCSYRVADERTGVWSCQSATAQDATG